MNCATIGPEVLEVEAAVYFGRLLRRSPRKYVKGEWKQPIPQTTVYAVGARGRTHSG